MTTARPEPAPRPVPGDAPELRLSVWATAQRDARAQRRGRYLPESTAHPAKMLPAIAATAIVRYTEPGDLVADPMCGNCPARPWVCLLCPLAIFTPRHAANLLRLKAFFARQWRQMPAAQFMAVFGPYAQRIEEILPRFAAPVLAEAARQVTGTDAEVPELRPEEATT